MSTENDNLPSPIATGLAGRCPRCGEGHLFNGFLNTASRCESCGLDYGFADSGDGPAIFVIFAAGFIIIALFALVELTIHPPMFMHLMLWLPLTVILCLALLRPFKGVMIALQYRHDAHEGHEE